MNANGSDPRQLPVAAKSLRRMLLPLALAQFICSFAGSNMNVMINDISHDLNTTVQGVQVCITLFLLVMAALIGLAATFMLPAAEPAPETGVPAMAAEHTPG